MGAKEGALIEASNTGVFLADTARAKRLGVKEVVLAECGHAYAALRWEVPNWFGETFPFKVTSLIEKLDDYITEGRLQFDPAANPEPTTYHASCHMARTGGVIEEPRRLLKAVAQHFV